MTLGIPHMSRKMLHEALVQTPAYESPKAFPCPQEFLDALDDLAGNTQD